MIGPDLLIVSINLFVGCAVLAVCIRRDRGIMPQIRLADALRQPLNGRQATAAITCEKRA